MARAALYSLAAQVTHVAQSASLHFFVDDGKCYASGQDDQEVLEQAIPAMQTFLGMAKAAELEMSDKSTILASKPHVYQGAHPRGAVQGGQGQG